MLPSEVCGAESPAQAGSLPQKTRLFTFIVVASNALGNLCLTHGMKGFAGQLSFSPAGYISAIFSPWVAAGIALLIVWLLTRMALLGWADLSYVLPVTSIGYVVSAVMGRYFLYEQVSLRRWAGTLLIVAGTAIVGRTGVRTS
jgi:uncharacterized membrane protein